MQDNLSSETMLNGCRLRKLSQSPALKELHSNVFVNFLFVFLRTVPSTYYTWGRDLQFVNNNNNKKVRG